MFNQLKGSKAMADKLSVRILFEVTTAEGKPYHSTELKYVNLPYEYLVQIEQVAAQAIVALAQTGAVQVDAKK
jgi:hypothetical protein